MRLGSLLRFGVVLNVSTAAVLGAPNSAFGAQYHYVDWTEADVAAGTATGTITLPDESVVTVTFAATREDGSPGTLHGAQTTPGTNYWVPSTPYESDEVENAPPDSDILQLEGGDNETYEVTLSEAIKDPLMAIVSLGQVNLETTYEFDSPFSIVSQGPGYWGGTDTSLVALDGNVLQGSEGHGTIRFIGTYSTFSWKVPTPENWHGFTFAIRTTERIEPTPTGEGGAGGAIGGGGEAGESGGTAGVDGTSAGSAGDETGAGADGAGGSGADGAGGSGARGGSGGEAGDDFSSSDDDVSCSCSVPGGASTSLEALVALSAALAVGLRRRHERTRRG